MERGPHLDLINEALARRRKFPVAAVVVVHDDISLLRAALEAAAIVVEYIVSVNGCTRKQVSRDGGRVCYFVNHRENDHHPLVYDPSLTLNTMACVHLSLHPSFCWRCHPAFPGIVVRCPVQQFNKG